MLDRTYLIRLQCLRQGAGAIPAATNGTTRIPTEHSRAAPKGKMSDKAMLRQLPKVVPCAQAAFDRHFPPDLMNSEWFREWHCLCSWRTGAQQRPRAQ